MTARRSSRCGFSVKPVDRGRGSITVGSTLMLLILASLVRSFEGGGLKYKSVAVLTLQPVLCEAFCCGAV